jgi:hypothetical protein
VAPKHAFKPCKFKQATANWRKRKARNLMPELSKKKSQPGTFETSVASDEEVDF